MRVVGNNIHQTPIPVTKPWLPPFKEFVALASDIFERRYVSNFSKYNELLEQRASVLFECEVLAVSSCDIGMTLAWKALGKHSGEVIVPSFTFASTVNAIVWNGLSPVFADIDPLTLCLSPDSVNALLTPATVGIAAVHIFGQPVSEEIDMIASEQQLTLVFDAAHAVGTTTAGRSLAGRGDASVFSLSGTKIITAGEGGLASFSDPAVRRLFRKLRGYGFIEDYNVEQPGLNGKMAELDAALGYLSFGLLDELIDTRMNLAKLYRRRLEGTNRIRMQPLAGPGDTRSYKDLVVMFDSATERAAVEHHLAANDIGVKRYFLPVHTMDAYRQLPVVDLPYTKAAWESALCLPIYHDLGPDNVNRICDLIEEALAIFDQRAA